MATNLKLTDVMTAYIDSGKLDRAYDTAYIIWNEDKDYDGVLEFRSRLSRLAQEDPSEEIMSLLKSGWFLTARDKFRDYLVCVEWDKPYESKFYLPRQGYLERLGLIDAYQDMHDGKLDLLTVSMPKRAGKSQTEINFVCFESGNRPMGASLIEGAGDDLVDSFYKGCLEYLDTSDIKYNYYEIFPKSRLIKQKADNHTLDLREKSRFPTIMCRSVDARQVGLSEATNVLVLDDCIEGRTEAKNRKRLDDKWEVINGDVIGRALEGTPIVASGTRYSVYDVIGHLQDRAITEGWRTKIIEVPALNPLTEKSNYEYYNPKTQRMTFTTEWLKNQRKSLSSEQWESEFQQKPFESKGILFPTNELNRYFELPSDRDPDSVVAVCDTAEGGGDSTMMPIAYIYGEDVFIEDCVFDNSTPEHTKPQCAKKLFEHKVVTATFESNLAGTYYARDVAELLKEMGGKCNIRTKRTISNKKTRIELASDNILKHFYFKDASLYEPTSEYGQMMKELTTYTRLGKVPHDDAPDGLSLLENELRQLNPNVAVLRDRFY